MKHAMKLAALTALLLTPSLQAQASEEMMKKAAENFAQADGDADGALTLEEFTKLIDLNAEDEIGRAAMVKRMGKQSTAFERVDANADGIVSTEELEAMASRAQQ